MFCQPDTWTMTRLLLVRGHNHQEEGVTLYMTEFMYQRGAKFCRRSEKQMIPSWARRQQAGESSCRRHELGLGGKKGEIMDYKHWGKLGKIQVSGNHTKTTDTEWHKAILGGEMSPCGWAEGEQQVLRLHSRVGLDQRGSDTPGYTWLKSQLQKTKGRVLKFLSRVSDMDRDIHQKI